ncbi:hypothetical protein L6452_03245 [Arctium lappa]|uniref:Uncharacterized protein n=1 Tax=Arctium lappa TaxID=4217 RepID=A0ACB9FM84_ARCLA|nr:hypothetical protein L6452_03245 [Arctium lappa]
MEEVLNSLEGVLSRGVEKAFIAGNGWELLLPELVLDVLPTWERHGENDGEGSLVRLGKVEPSLPDIDARTYRAQVTTGRSQDRMVALEAKRVSIPSNVDVDDVDYGPEDAPSDPRQTDDPSERHAYLSTQITYF